MSNPANTSSASGLDRAGSWVLTYQPVAAERWLIIVTQTDRCVNIETSSERVQDVLLHIISTMEGR